MIKFKLHLCQVILALAGLLFEWLAFQCLLFPPNTDLADVAFPDDQTSVADFKQLLAALTSTAVTHPNYVNILFMSKFVFRHLFPPCDAMLLLKALMIHFNYTGLLLFTCDEFHLNLMAGILYGPWLGLTLCCALTSLAAVISIALVTCILLVFDRMRRRDGDGLNGGRAGGQQPGFMANDEPLVEFLIDEELVDDEEQAIMQQVLHESFFLALNAMFLVRLFPFIPSWLLHLVFAVLGVPVPFAVLTLGLGYVPFAWHCISLTGQMTHLDSFESVYSGRHFHWLLFGASTFLTFHNVAAQWDLMRQRAGVRDEDVFGEEDEQLENAANGGLINDFD